MQVSVKHLRTEEEHLVNLWKLFGRLRKYRLRLNLEDIKQLISSSSSTASFNNVDENKTEEKAMYYYYY